MGIFQDCCTSFQDCCQENCGCCGDKPEPAASAPAAWRKGTQGGDSAQQGPFPPPPSNFASGALAGGHRRSPHQKRDDEPDREADVTVPSSDALASPKLEKPLVLEQPEITLPIPQSASAPKAIHDKTDLTNDGEFSQTKAEKAKAKADKKKQQAREKKAEAEKRREAAEAAAAAAAAEQKKGEQAKREAAPADVAQSVAAPSHVQPIKSSKASVEQLADQLEHLAVSPPKAIEQRKKKNKKQGSKQERREKKTLSASLPDHQSKSDASAIHKEMVKDSFKPDEDGFQYPREHIRKIAKRRVHHSTLASPSAA